MNKDTLYVIGNGFDLAHGFETNYRDFAEYLKKTNKYYQLYHDIIDNCNLKEEDIWSDFEKALGEINTESLADYEDFNPATDYDFLERDSWAGIYRIEDTVEYNLSSFLKNLRKSFYEWISQVKIRGKTIFDFKDNAIFLNFNYTKTLEKIYNIKVHDIHHIHGSVSSKESIILGHNKKLIKKNEKMWVEEVNTSLESFEKNTFKNTDEVCACYGKFFKSLSNIDNVVILGHSLSDVDSLYFQKICSNVNLDDCKFYVSYYDRNERDSKKEFLTNLGVKENNIESFLLDEDFEYDKSILKNL